MRPARFTIAAFAAHWLDGIVGFYVAAFLLGRLLLADRGHGASAVAPVRSEKSRSS